MDSKFGMYHGEKWPTSRETPIYKLLDIGQHELHWSLVIDVCYSEILVITISNLYPNHYQAI